jgi:hypothetical protein
MVWASLPTVPTLVTLVARQLRGLLFCSVRSSSSSKSVLVLHSFFAHYVWESGCIASRCGHFIPGEIVPRTYSIGSQEDTRISVYDRKEGTVPRHY